MKAYLFSNQTILGTFSMRILDESMGVITGNFSPTDHYITDFQQAFREHLVTPNWEIIKSFNLSVKTEDGNKLNPAGGIIVNDFESFSSEFTIEVCGINLEGLHLEYYKP